MEHFEYVSKTIKRGGEFSAASVMTRESPFDILFDEFGPDTFEVIAITLYGPNKDEYNYIGLSDARFELVEKRFESYLNLNGKDLRQVLEGDKIVQSNLGTFSDTDGISVPQSNDIGSNEREALKTASSLKRFTYYFSLYVGFFALMIFFVTGVEILDLILNQRVENPLQLIVSIFSLSTFFAIALNFKDPH